MTVSPPLSDSFGRTMRDLRVSLTDRCNFRCVYCLPETEEAANFYRSKFDPRHNPNPAKLPLPALKPRSEILDYEEIGALVRIFARLGVDKIRLTGGEPLLRRNVETLVRDLASIPGIRDLAMTTNGFLFRRHARALKEAGLTRISFSLDSLDRATFKKMTGRDGLEEVLAAIDLAIELGLNPVKVNAVVIRGLNEHEIGPLTRHAVEKGISIRFIEFMPLDSSRAWLKELVVPGREVLERAGEVATLTPARPSSPAETARRWLLDGGPAEVGIIAPVTEPFCGHCNRLRLTADGKLRTCLFSLGEHDLKTPLRGGASEAEMTELLRAIVLTKEDRHHIGEEDFQQPERTMSCIGG